MKLMWFRRDLRTIDNLALWDACQSGEPVLAIYYETPKQWQQHGQSPIQTDLIQRRLQQLQINLADLNIPLLFQSVPLFADIMQSLALLCQEYKVTDVYCTKDHELDEINRDNAVAGVLSLTGIQFHVYDQKCIFPPNYFVNQRGNPYKVFTPFKKAWLAELSLQDVSVLPAPRPIKTNQITLKWLQKSDEFIFRYPLQDSVGWPVDDVAIEQRLKDFCRYRVDQYHQLRDYPAIPATSQLSPYLAIGAISPKQCLARLNMEESSALQSGIGGAAVWLSELIWRDFYQHIIATHRHLCRGESFQTWTEAVKWNRDELLFERWKQGKTGFPIIDAAMRQLNELGWMHNRLRMIVASFLVKDLHIDWRWGERYFMSKLIDGDFAANNGGWQWGASVGTDAQPYMRVFNPTTQSKKFDPQGRFIRRWLPELDSVPDQALHEPHHWAQKQGIELSYPKPIVDHKIARQQAIALFEDAKKELTSKQVHL